MYPKTGFSGSVKLTIIILELKRNQKGIEKNSKETEKVTKKKSKWNLMKFLQTGCAKYFCGIGVLTFLN